MVKTYLYIPEKLQERITEAATAQNKPKAEILRQAIEKGLANQVPEDPSASAKTLLQLAEIGQRHKLDGPRDLSKNMDKYLWGL